MPPFVGGHLPPCMQYRDVDYIIVYKIFSKANLLSIKTYTQKLEKIFLPFLTSDQLQSVISNYQFISFVKIFMQGKLLSGIFLYGKMSYP